MDWDGRYVVSEKKRRQYNIPRNYRHRGNKRGGGAVVMGKLLSGEEIIGQEGNKERLYT